MLLLGGDAFLVTLVLRLPPVCRLDKHLAKLLLFLKRHVRSLLRPSLEEAVGVEKLLGSPLFYARQTLRGCQCGLDLGSSPWVLPEHFLPAKFDIVDIKSKDARLLLLGLLFLILGIYNPHSLAILLGLL